MIKLTLCHLYPELLNLYGDTGNILTLVKRCQWRGINLDIVNYNVGDKGDFKDVDIFFIGGGADSDQIIAGHDMKNIKPELKDAVEEGKALLAICGGYQLLGHYYQNKDDTAYGLGLLDFYTEPGDSYFVGNIVVRTHDYHLVGFENHTGRTWLNGLKPLGYVVSGFGNNGEDQTEGLRYKNVIGTYLHGPLLPKNPKLCDEIISIALKNKYNIESLEELDDSLEIKAREHTLRSISNKYSSLA
jgi:CobQ-like glutamine amidotransferase family enzyme